MSNLKKNASSSKQDLLELLTLRYVNRKVMSPNLPLLLYASYAGLYVARAQSNYNLSVQLLTVKDMVV